MEEVEMEEAPTAGSRVREIEMEEAPTARSRVRAREIEMAEEAARQRRRKSGIFVQDPTKGVHGVDAVFDQPRQMGAMQGSFENVQAAPPPPENVVHTIYFWTNGFTIDDGPLRRSDDPANASFLKSIKMSDCPKELKPEDRRYTVHVNVIRREENCPEPLIQGGGFAPTESVAQGPATESFAQESAAAVSFTPAVAASVVVDDLMPTTTIQLLLADGSHTVARFNTDHTVGDIRAFINNHVASNGRAAPATYTLWQIGITCKQLTDATQTIEQAGLANSAVIQKL